MKHHIIFILVIISITIFGSCRDKISDSKTYTIKGKLLKNCGGEVIANTELKIISKSQVFTQGFSAIATTDANGNFVFSYDRNGGADISLRVASGSKILEEIPNNTDIDLGIIYYTPTCNFVFKLVVDNPYTSLDTMLISDFNYILPFPNYGFHIIPGPFKDTILSPVFGHTPIATRTFDKLGVLTINYGYSIWKGPRNTADNRLMMEGFYTDVQECSVGIDTIIVRIK
jgi:hypothetical protein